MNLRRIGARLAAAACVVAATVALDTSTAQAELTDCTVTSNPDTNRGSVRCTSGTGGVRVVVTCVFRHTLNEYPVYGQWVGVGGTSSAGCGTSGASWLAAVDYELRP